MKTLARSGWLQAGLLMLGLLLIAVWSLDALESRAFQSAASVGLDAAGREAATAPSNAPPCDGATGGLRPPEPPGQARDERDVLGRIEIPRLRIHAIVAEGSDASTLRHAVGHVESTALPGAPGNVALAGHRDSFFRGLGGVHKDDLIRFETREATYAYRVAWTEIVDPRRVDVLAATATPSLTLITCYPFQWVGHAPKRFVVRAVLVGTRGEDPGHPAAPAADAAERRRHVRHARSTAAVEE